MATQSSDKKKNIHEGHRQRLRDRFERSGNLDGFSDHEVLELLLTYVIPRVDVNEQAHELVDRFGSVAGALDAHPTELCTVEGIGPSAARFLIMLPEVFRRYSLNKTNPQAAMDTLAMVGDYLYAIYTGISVEQVYLLLFDNSMHMIQCKMISEGSINCSNITVRKIAEIALFNRASAVILAHNHPRGLPIPSSNDLEVTQSVDNALETLGIPLLEHIIVTENSYAPILRHRKGLLRASPRTDKTDIEFYQKFYDET